jgi:effector-binding domain-containing protein
MVPINYAVQRAYIFIIRNDSWLLCLQKVSNKVNKPEIAKYVDCFFFDNIKNKIVYAENYIRLKYLIKRNIKNKIL